MSVLLKSSKIDLGSWVSPGMKLVGRKGVAFPPKVYSVGQIIKSVCLFLFVFVLLISRPNWLKNGKKKPKTNKKVITFCEVSQVNLTNLLKNDFAAPSPYIYIPDTPIYYNTNVNINIFQYFITIFSNTLITYLYIYSDAGKECRTTWHVLHRTVYISYSPFSAGHILADIIYIFIEMFSFTLLLLHRTCHVSFRRHSSCGVDYGDHNDWREPIFTMKWRNFSMNRSLL